ncbi:MAG: ATP-binding cassette domain-containing protein [Acidimicrobiia bacterium]|nr:ATP-binding cassette domain-containing protein [Acidimicrobiia bacterium]
MLAVDGLTFGYRRTEPILEDLSFEFPAGSVTAVTGASGQGKSTLLYILGLMISPQGGHILLDSADVGGWSDRRRSELRARRFGFVFQDAALDASRSVIDNIIEGSLYAGLKRRVAREKATELMERFGVNLRSDHKPGEVSGGQAARVALCRALVTDPDVILADEPTGNLDSKSAGVVIDALARAAHSGAVVVVASHDQTVTQRADVVLDLDNDQ